LSWKGIEIIILGNPTLPGLAHNCRVMSYIYVIKNITIDLVYFRIFAYYLFATGENLYFSSFTIIDFSILR
jgi:hypothetical protein